MAQEIINRAKDGALFLEYKMNKFFRRKKMRHAGLKRYWPYGWYHPKAPRLPSRIKLISTLQAFEVIEVEYLELAF